MRLRLAGAGVLGATVGLVAAVGVGLAAAFITFRTYAALDDNEDAVAAGIGTMTAMGAAIATVPLASSLFVQRTGRAAGYRGRYGYTLMGASGGVLLGVATGMAYLFVRDSTEGQRYLIEEEMLAAGVVGAAANLISTGALCMLSYRLSDQHRVRVSPLINGSVERQELTLGLGGRF